jgi:DNA-binding MarR family transcriptional regulator
MSIEEAIRQKKFDNEYIKLAVNILFTSGWISVLDIQRLKPHGLSPQQFNVLRILRGSQGKALRLGDISSRMIDRNSNATRLVEKLRIKGLVKREICEDNRRQVNIWITPKGLSLLAELDQFEERWTEPFKNISKAEAKQMNLLLDKLREGK